MKNTSKRFNKMIGMDMDGTLIGDDDSMYKLLKLIDENTLLSFSTGRHLPSVMAFINEKEIRKPDACILLVGTEVYLLKEEEFVPDDNWSQIISEDWDREEIVRLLADIKELTLQDEEWQTRFKLSYFLRENQDEVLKEIDNRMEKAKLKANVIYSGSQFLDFLPMRASKVRAAVYLADKFGIDREAIVFCGDSGNDLDAFEAGFKGIIVGNAHPELKAFKAENAYHAVGNYSAGIIEGLRYFNFI